MTSTPSRTIVMNEARKAEPNRPAGCASSSATRFSTWVERRSMPRRECFSVETSGDIAAQPTELDLERANLLRPASQQITLERLEFRHVDRRQLGGRLEGPVTFRSLLTRRNPRLSSWSINLGSPLGPSWLESRSAAA